MSNSSGTTSVLAVVGAVFGAAVAAPAATIVVTSDTGGIGGPACTLRDAITAANSDTATGGCQAGSGVDVIELPVGAIITLTEVDNDTDGPNGLPSITSVVTINGNGTTVRRDDFGGTPDFRIIHVAEGGDVTLNDISASEGGRASPGGGILNAGTLSLNNSTVSGNAVSGLGGGIFNSGALSLNNSTVGGNGAAPGIGGGIYNDTTGTLTLNTSTISGNGAGGLFSSGGGIFNSGTLTLAASTVSGNTSAGLGGGGGGITNAGTLTLADSTLSGNAANGGSGILNFGPLTVTNSTISGNGSGGIAGFGMLPLDDLTLRGGSALLGGPVQLGGGILNGGTATLTNSTVSGNGGAGGIFNSGTLTLTHSIVASSADVDCVNDGGTVTDGGYNIVEDGSCITAATSMMGDPMLGPLQNNGGPTLTHALLAGSPAFDAIPSEECAVGTDQRGVPRPQGDGCDIGSYETQVDDDDDSSDDDSSDN
jgi:hypothetical protein